MSGFYIAFLFFVIFRIFDLYSLKLLIISRKNLIKLPAARNTELVVQELGKGLLVYDLITNKAYQLNETSMIVYRACGEGWSLADLKRKYKFTDDLIYLALDELKKNDLIAEDHQSKFVDLPRREVIRKVGLASVIALPIITKLIAPQAAMAASTSCTPSCTGTRPVCATSGSAAGQCCTAGGTNRNSSGTQIGMGSSTFGTCRGTECNDAPVLIPFIATCCNGAVRTNCNQISNGFTFTCNCTA